MLNMDEPSHKRTNIVIPLIRGAKVVKFIEIESRMVVPTGWGRKRMELLINRHRFWFLR
jgi:hypothetical protein